MTGNVEVFEYQTEGDTLILLPVAQMMTLRDSDLRDAYNQTFRLLMDGNIQNLIVDFSRLEYFGSTFVGIMIRLAQKIASLNGRTVLCTLNEDTRGILKQLMLLEHKPTEFLWSHVETRDQALELIRTGAVSP